MTCPMDPLKLYSRAMIFHNIMQVIQIEASDVERIFLDLFCFNIHMLEVLYLVQLDLQ